MKLTSILSGDGFVMYNKQLARLVSSNGAIIFGQLCSSYESFDSKNMLINIDGKEYFFLTTKVIKEETSLGYKKQATAIKELENYGLIETFLGGIPAKKHFHITDKIVDLFMSNTSYTKKEKLMPKSFDKMDKQECTIGQRQHDPNGSCIKENNKKKKKERIIVNKDKLINDLKIEFFNKGLSKYVMNLVIKEADQNKEIENYGAYLRTCLENTLYKSKFKRGLIEPIHNRNSVFYNWLDE